jgi:hypothetical protein
MNWDYFSGFIDGEGSIIFNPPRIRLYISNTNKEVLEQIKNFVGCGSVFEVKRKMKENWKKQYGWTICSHENVLRILKNIKKKLIIKQKICEEAINYIESKRWQKTYLSKEELIKWKYLNSSRKIAERLGVSQTAVLKYLKIYGLFRK